MQALCPTSWRSQLHPPRSSLFVSPSKCAEQAYEHLCTQYVEPSEVRICIDGYRLRSTGWYYGWCGSLNLLSYHAQCLEGLAAMLHSHLSEVVQRNTTDSRDTHKPCLNTRPACHFWVSYQLASNQLYSQRARDILGALSCLAVHNKYDNLPSLTISAWRTYKLL